MNRRMDEDEYQEYQCLLLEGHDEAEARKLARSANNRINSERLSGPRSHDRNGHGRPPLVTDFMWGDLWQDKVPVTLDTRLDSEREDDYAMADKVQTLLDHCTDIQRAVITDIYGFETGTPMTYQQVADKHGRSIHWVQKHRTAAVKKMRSYKTPEQRQAILEARRERLREQKREQARRRRERRRQEKFQTVG